MAFFPNSVGVHGDLLLTLYVFTWIMYCPYVKYQYVLLIYN